MSRPDEGEALLERGRAAYGEGRLDDAIAAFRAAIGRVADGSRPWHNLGVALRAAGHPQAAIPCYRRALEVSPDSAETWGALGSAYQDVGDERVAACLSRAAELDPSDADYHYGLGLVLLGGSDPAAALAPFDAAMALRPDRADVRFQRACTLLRCGRYAEAWEGFEQRLEARRLARAGFETPLWTGEPLDGRRLLVHAEQGIGDMIQFARFLPAAIEATGGNMVIECHPPLKRLLAANFPTVRVAAVDEPVPEHDLHASVLSLPYLLGLPDSAVTMADPYLHWPSSAARRPVGRRPRVGLTWAGKPLPWNRSCPFELLLGLAEVTEVDFVSLQRGEAAGDIARHGAEGLVADLGSGMTDFADDAAALDDLDLVITIDTAAAHLVGAMGRPVWTLLTHRCDWRYPGMGANCDWYPTMRQFRQPAPGDWRSVIAQVRGALETWIADKARSI